MSSSTNTVNLENETTKNIELTKKDIQNLIQIIRLRKKECDDMDNETKYLKEYVASFISMGELKK